MSAVKARISLADRCGVILRLLSLLTLRYARTRGVANRIASVAPGPRILIVAALESTLAPTEELIRESAAALGAAVENQHLLVQGAWLQFMRSDCEAYLESVAMAVRFRIIDDEWPTVRRRLEEMMVDVQ